LAYDWTRVLADPLGIVGFVLFLIFGVLAKVKTRDERRWLSRASIALASVALIGGLGLAFIKVTRESPALGSSQSNQKSGSASVKKNDLAPGQSIVVQGDSNTVIPVSNVETKGDLTINAGRPSDKPSAKKPSPKSTR
jgi:hypothetical protein